MVVACTASDMAADMLLVEFVSRTHHPLAPAGTEEAHKSAAADAPADIDETGTAAAAAAVVSAGNKAAAAAVVPAARKKAAAVAAATDTAADTAVVVAAAAATCTAAAAAFAVSGTGAVGAAATETGTLFSSADEAHRTAATVVA